MLICIKKIVCFWCVSLVLVGGRVQAAEAYRRWRAGPTPAPSTVACSDVTASPANDLPAAAPHQLANIKCLTSQRRLLRPQGDKNGTFGGGCKNDGRYFSSKSGQEDDLKMTTVSGH